MQHRKNRLVSVIAGALLAAIAAVIWLGHEIEYRTIPHPNGEYSAVVTYRRYLGMIPMMPGQSGDRRGYVSMRDKDGRKFGKKRIQMLSLADDIHWAPEAAEIKLVARWDLTGRNRIDEVAASRTKQLMPR